MITFNPTKIVCTLGPASAREDTLAAMIEAGMDVARLNFSHGTHEDHARTYELIQRVAGRLGAFVGVLADLQGPKIRTGEMPAEGAVLLTEGAELTITTDACVGTPARVSTTYQHLPLDVKPGDRILLDDGLLELRVEGTAGHEVLCRVITGGLLGAHKGINLPGVAVSAPCLTEKDLADVRFALDLGVDYLALSFVREPQDVHRLREFCQACGREVPIVTKLEKPEALDHLDEIVGASDAVMIARGDLGVELSPEAVPIWQKRIIAACALQGKPVITATQMLESMRENPRPTRAEASDVANAIFDGTDAVMLSAETATGEYPVEAVTMMRRIAAEAEGEQGRWQHREWLKRPDHEQLAPADAVSRAAVRVAQEVGARVLVAFTESGSTARMASKRRPRLPILACTPFAATARRCTLYWGVLPVLVQTVNDTDEMIALTAAEVKRLGYAQAGERIVLTAGTPMGQHGTTNTLRVETVE